MLKFHNKVLDLVAADPALRKGSETDVRGGAADRPLALPVARRPRLPAPHGRHRDAGLGAGRDRHAAEGRARTSTPGATTRTCRWSSRSRRTASATPRSAAATSSTRSSARWPTFLPTQHARRRDPAAALRRLPDPAAGSGRSSGRGSSRSTAPASDARQPTRLIDTKLANPLAALPPEIGGNRPSLIDRNLTRGARLLLPSGQDVACHMGADVLSDAELALPGGGPAPLWYYILDEAAASRPAVGTSARSAAGSSPRSSSACWRRTRPPTCATSPAGSRSSPATTSPCPT